MEPCSAMTAALRVTVPACGTMTDGSITVPMAIFIGITGIGITTRVPMMVFTAVIRPGLVVERGE